MWWANVGFILLMVALLLASFALGLSQATMLNPVHAYCHGAAEGTAAFYFDNYGQMPNLSLRQEYESDCRGRILRGEWMVMDLSGPILPE